MYLVDDGSRDRSGEIAKAHAAVTDRITLVQRPVRAPERDRLAAAGEFKAFTSMAEQLESSFDVIAKMDADLDLLRRPSRPSKRRLSMSHALALRVQYSMRSTPLESRAPVTGARDHVRGATKFYRSACWREITPIPAILGWDTLDEFVARMHGWQTRSLSVPGGQPLPSAPGRHTRPHSPKLPPVG